MKRVLCPKCDNYITFDETKYEAGQSLVFICQHCKKEFGIRLGKSRLKSAEKNQRTEDPEESSQYGSLVVIENVFGYRQVIPLVKGDNIIGRRSKGTEINTPVETSDMSMDRRHCILNVSINKHGETIYTLRDNPSLTGTFLNNELIGDKERVRIDPEAIITLGATTIILKGADNPDEL